MKELEAKNDFMNMLVNQKEMLEDQISQADKPKLDKHEFKENDSKVKFFTGLPSFTILIALYNLVSDSLNTGSRHLLKCFAKT